MPLPQAHIQAKILAQEKIKASQNGPKTSPVIDAISFIHTLHQLKDNFTPKKGKDYLSDEELAQIKKQSTPVKGKDYFTDEDLKKMVNFIRDEVTPKKGVHYFDGKNGSSGRDGKDGLHGMNGLAGKDGQDGKDGKDADADELREDILAEVTKLLEGKKYGVKDIDDLETRLVNLQNLVKQNYGGHGGVTKISTLTTSDNTTYTLSPTLQLSELAVYRGGARIFSQNGDFTYTLTSPNKVKTITLATPLDVAQGETLNILGKS